MYTLLKSVTVRQFIFEQIPAFVISLIVAELFYKFHSFTLECLAFLATWYLVNLATTFVFRTLTSHDRPWARNILK